MVLPAGAASDLQVTLQCIPAHKLLEHTRVMDARQIERDHARMLRENQHLRYMWIPYTDSVVVVTNNPLKQVTRPHSGCRLGPSWVHPGLVDIWVTGCVLTNSNVRKWSRSSWF